ncbi:Oligomerization domain-containing protein [Mycotypha africana]|uniref:Oligomerization domain-containing protein n=1 Tax=Mycotypha africana TaxID=64632 RepID=UPI0023006700|nr:Oligomerization domain-containing protein [Mycotypha africana]KAI8981969.1 Oligomerization domain-containing protein [Mycotypha africana]
MALFSKFRAQAIRAFTAQQTFAFSTCQTSRTVAALTCHSRNMLQNKYSTNYKRWFSDQKPADFDRFSDDPSTNNSTATTRDIEKTEEEEEDSLEEIDPKDYPELFSKTKECFDDSIDESDAVDTEWFVDPDYNDSQPLSEEDFIPLWQRRAVEGAVSKHLENRLALQQASQKLMETGTLTADTIKSLLEESNMDDITVLDVRQKCDWADSMIIASTDKGNKYLNSIAEHVRGVVKKAIQAHPETLKEQALPRIEGKEDQSGWVLVDLGRIVVHLFTPEQRQHYQLEKLWQETISTDPTQPMSLENIEKAAK